MTFTPMHDATWHTKRLPEGWQASPDAHKLAAELGVTLQPGETFVRAHKRGSRLLGEVTAHQFIHRPH